MKKIFAKLKTLFDAYKMYVFFMALLFGTNGAQLYSNYEPDEQAEAAPQKTVIIRKADNRFCKDLLKEHELGDRH